MQARCVARACPPGQRPATVPASQAQPPPLLPTCARATGTSVEFVKQSGPHSFRGGCRPNPSRKRHKFTVLGPSSTQVELSSDKLWACSTDADQNWLGSSEFDPKPTNCGPSATEFGPPTVAEQIILERSLNEVAKSKQARCCRIWARDDTVSATRFSEVCADRGSVCGAEFDSRFRTRLPFSERQSSLDL